jgi:hypothetical protein
MTERRIDGFGSDLRWQVAVTVPARDEARRLRACLDAAALALAGRGGVVVAANGCRDETAGIARGWFEATGLPGAVIDEPDAPAGGGVGRARRLAIATALDRLSPEGIVMTTDADSRVAPDWVAANLAELGAADLICGQVLPDPGESGDLPARIGELGAPEGEYEQLTRRALWLLDPVAHDPEPAHLNAAGASLAFGRALHDSLGGMPALAMGEDRAFAAAAEAAGWRVRHSTRARVVTSCRLTGRTAGGMAGALRSRITDADPLVDELLRPSEVTLLRARLRAELRRRVPARDFGPAWARIEAERPEIAPPRMRLSELRAELPRLRRAVAEIEMDLAAMTAS